MPITDFLTRNSEKYGDEIALIELNPEEKTTGRMTWKEYSLIQPTGGGAYRREISWSAFNGQSNIVANMLIGRGYKRGDKIGILMMNCLEWLPIYFGILKAGMIAVPFNFRYTADEILYCAGKSELDMILFGPQFIGRIESIVGKLDDDLELLYVGDNCPSFAECFAQAVDGVSDDDPGVRITNHDDAAIYFSSGTTGFPKAILHNHESLMHAALTEQNHHSQNRDDVFLCIPPLYHTGA
ncbi:MAG: acyl--CoA ligase, partial [Eubacterium sp.]|nr:acyl--CoA ligase [Eubacterium sp.]